MSEYLLAKCRELFSQEEYQKVINVCDEILKHDFNDKRALGYKARCLYFLKRFDEALTLLNNALVLYPNNYHYLFIKADVFMYMEDYAKSSECFEEILKTEVVDLDYIKREYRICLSLRTDQLIEKEKYVNAWKCYNRMLEMDSVNLEKQQIINEFIKYVKKHTSKIKYRKYYVKISSKEAKRKLFDFLKENGFKSNHEAGLLFLIDVVDKTFNSICVDNVGDNNIISESKFYDKINYQPKDNIVKRKLHDEDGRVVYEGYTLDYSPYGYGIAYFANGNVYREGIFDFKGIVQGKEYYPSGKIRFKGQWCLTWGYGPNAPCDGDAFNEDGDLIYSGKFEIKRGGVGWPMIQKPKGFGLEQKQRPKIDYYR